MVQVSRVSNARVALEALASTFERRTRMGLHPERAAAYERAAKMIRAVCDAGLRDLEAERDRLAEGVARIVEGYDNTDLVTEFDCCGCSKPWELYDRLLAELKDVRDGR